MPRLSSNETKKRINIYVTDDFLAGLDNYAAEMGISRSSAAAVLIKQSLTQHTAIDAMNKLKLAGIDISQVFTDK